MQSTFPRDRQVDRLPASFGLAEASPCFPAEDSDECRAVRRLRAHYRGADPHARSHRDVADRHRRNARRTRRIDHRRRDDARQCIPVGSDRIWPQLGAQERDRAVRGATLGRRAYLVWLGIQAWRGAGTSSKAAAPGGRVNFVRGMLVAASNPKTIAFFTAFLPQFIDPALPAGRQLVAMCIVSVLLAAATDSAWAVAAGLGRAWFLKPARAKLLGRLSGSILIGGGIWLSLARRSS
jgi:hypothetical protein